MSKKLILIVGLQKSGTTLLSRLLQLTGLVEDPFWGEGHEFWGNRPVLSPREFPVGAIYQESQGKRGHEMDESDFTDEGQEEMRSRLEQIEHKLPLLLNKNPFNTGRLPWLRKVFPQSYIVATFRDPVPNVYSLLKKFEPHKKHRSLPEHGWWGVKPADWEALVSEDKVKQTALQWAKVNQRLRDDARFLDLSVSYEALCRDPQAIVEKIIKGLLGERFSLTVQFPQLLSRDFEFKTGGAVVSANLSGLAPVERTDKETEQELRPLTAREITKIRTLCE